VKRSSHSGAQSHPNDRDSAHVVEQLAIHAEPAAQPVAGGIVERQAGQVDFGSGRLAGDQDPRGVGDAKDRTGAKRQGSFAAAAGEGFGAGGCEGVSAALVVVSSHGHQRNMAIRRANRKPDKPGLALMVCGCRLYCESGYDALLHR
jgi:hypothetical protein